MNQELSWPADTAATLPTGGKVQAGSAVTDSPIGAKLTIDQSSGRAIIDWSSFLIGAADAVQFNNGTGASLNRVSGSSEAGTPFLNPLHEK